MSRRIKPFGEADLQPHMVPLYRKSMTRIREKMATSPAMRALIDAQGRLNGPPSLWVLSPGVGDVLEQMQGAIRNTMELSPYHAEIVILMVGHHLKSEFEIFAHRMAAAAVGIEETVVETILAGREPAFTASEDRMVHSVAHSLIHTRDLTDDLYEAAVAELGERRVFEIVTVVGFYEAIALQLGVFRIGPA